MCNLRQVESFHDYVSNFYNLLVQSSECISPLEQRFYFQQGLRRETSRVVNEQSPEDLETTIAIAAQYEQAHFAQGDNNWTNDAICHRCKTKGHIAPDCPHK